MREGKKVSYANWRVPRPCQVSAKQMSTPVPSVRFWECQAFRRFCSHINKRKDTDTSTDTPRIWEGDENKIEREREGSIFEQATTGTCSCGVKGKGGYRILWTLKAQVCEWGYPTRIDIVSHKTQQSIHKTRFFSQRRCSEFEHACTKREEQSKPGSSKSQGGGGD